MRRRRFKPYEPEQSRLSESFEIAGTILLVAAPISIFLGAGLETVEAQTWFAFAWFFPAMIIGAVCMVIAEAAKQ